MKGGILNSHLNIGVDCWIIRDGNYANFIRGQSISFALEFFAPHKLIEVAPADTPYLNNSYGAYHEASGPIVHLMDNWWAVNFGIKLFRHGKPPTWAKIGSWVQGFVYVGVDPFYYSKEFSLASNAIPLIYNWRVEKIQRDVTPMNDQENIHIYDRSLRTWIEVDATDAWADGLSASYLLQCALLSKSEQRRITTSQLSCPSLPNGK